MNTNRIIKSLSFINYLAGIILFLYALSLFFGIVQGQSMIISLFIFVAGVLFFIAAKDLKKHELWAYYFNIFSFLSIFLLSIIRLSTNLLYLTSLLISLLLLIYFVYSKNTRSFFNIEQNISTWNYIKKINNYQKQDTWQSWILSLYITFVSILLILFPLLSFITNTSLPLVVIESCSMYHESSFNSWWQSNSNWYETKNINKEQFESYSFKNGLNKGDIIFVWGRSEYKKGDIIIFEADTQYPIIHRLVSQNPTATKGDHNSAQLPIETSINNEKILGKSVFRIPYLGWIKLIFFDLVKPSSERGLCK